MVILPGTASHFVSQSGLQTTDKACFEYLLCKVQAVWFGFL